MAGITRRDLVNGVLVAAGASVLPLGCRRAEDLDELDAAAYPPSFTGLRGSHPSSYAHAHARAFDGKSEWGPTTELSEDYEEAIMFQEIPVGVITSLFGAPFFLYLLRKKRR